VSIWASTVPVVTLGPGAETIRDARSSAPLSNGDMAAEFCRELFNKMVQGCPIHILVVARRVGSPPLFLAMRFALHNETDKNVVLRVQKSTRDRFGVLRAPACFRAAFFSPLAAAAPARDRPSRELIQVEAKRSQEPFPVHHSLYLAVSDHPRASKRLAPQGTRPAYQILYPQGRTSVSDCG